MKTRWGALWLLLVVLGIYGAMVAYYRPLLPERLATHFGPSGRPDGWMSRDGFLTFLGLFLPGMWAFLGGLGALMSRLPVDQINLPHKEFWLAPERAAATYGYLRGFMLNLNTAVMALLLALAQSTFQANLRPEPRLGSGSALLMIAFIGFVLYSILTLYGRFKRLPPG
jgi:uncharacterized membrane protein